MCELKAKLKNSEMEVILDDIKQQNARRSNLLSNLQTKLDKLLGEENEEALKENVKSLTKDESDNDGGIIGKIKSELGISENQILLLRNIYERFEKLV